MEDKPINLAEARNHLAIRLEAWGYGRKGTCGIFSSNMLYFKQYCWCYKQHEDPSLPVSFDPPCKLEAM
jgi:hypothetical protein